MIEEKDFPDFPCPDAHELARKFSAKSRKALNAVREEAAFNGEEDVVEVFSHERVLHSAWKDDSEEFQSIQTSKGRGVRKTWFASAIAMTVAAVVGVLFSVVAGVAIAIFCALLMLLAIKDTCELRANRRRGYTDWLERKLLNCATSHVLIGRRALYVVSGQENHYGEFEAQTVFYDAVGIARMKHLARHQVLEIRSRSGSLIYSMREPVSLEFDSTKIANIITDHSLSAMARGKDRGLINEREAERD
jgi:hypothetical protein